MSVKQVRNVVQRFLEQPENEVLAIKGAWGVGKTYAWHHLVAEYKSIIRPSTYCYVSLFGIASLADLRMAILTNSRPVEDIGSTMTLSSINRNWFSVAVAKANGLRQKWSNLDGGAVLKDVFVTLDALTPSLISKRLICFDDFERLDTKKISHDTLLGFISMLKETADCRVAIILNDAQVPKEEEMYQKYREKVIDKEIVFDPTADEAIAWGLKADVAYFSQIKDCAKLLDIRNVRILKKAASVVASIAPILSGKHVSVSSMSIHSTVLLTWSYYEKTGLAPSLQFVKGTNLLATVKGRRKKGGEPLPSTPEEDRWTAILSAYKFGYYDDFDEALVKVIERGYLEGSGFEAAVNLREADSRRGDLHRTFEKAWGLFHDSMADNELEVVAALQEGFKVSAQMQNPSNLNAVVVLLRELDQGALADDLIEFYVNARGHERGVFDLDNDTFGNQVSDPTIREAFAAKLATFASQGSLREAVEKMATANSWSAEEQEIVAAATVEDFYSLFEQIGRVPTHKMVAATRRLNQPPVARIAQRAEMALRRLGGESRINRIRIRSYGINLAEPDTHTE
jgi:hypothetical protein